MVYFRYRGKAIKAESGDDSSKARILGRRGEDLKLIVPTGVTVFDANMKRIGELNAPGDTCIAAHGGVGGCTGNNFIGSKGTEQVVTLDLKLIADVGMVRSIYIWAEAVSKDFPSILGWISECGQEYATQSNIKGTAKDCCLSV